MKMNHEMVRKYLRIFGILAFIVAAFFKFKHLIDNAGKNSIDLDEDDDDEDPQVQKAED